MRNQLESGIFSDVLLRDLFRFRVFIDSVMLLFNREKLEKEFFKNKFVYNQFFTNLKNDEEMKSYLSSYRQFLSEKFSHHIPEFDKFYIPYNTETVRPYDQLARVRNALAHMNYGHFEFLKMPKYGSDYLVGYNIYNRDSKTNRSKNHGFILEPVLHRFIQSYFSNYTSYGIVYKHTWFNVNGYNAPNQPLDIDTGFEFKVNRLTYVADDKYGGEPTHDMIRFTKKLKSLSSEEIQKYIHDNNDKYNHTTDNVPYDEINRLLQFTKRELMRKELGVHEFSQSIKFLFDFETEFSNFLVHLMQLNDRLIDYSAPFVSRKHENTTKILSSIEELKEDKFSWLAFKYMFPLLDVINICLRMEDDDLLKINPRDINILGFNVDCEKVVEFRNNNYDSSDMKDINNIYVLERLRNSIAHGHIYLFLSDKGEIIYEFSDIWNKRKEKISISYSELKSFIKQPIFKERK